jgi:hypothetical protein
VEDGQTLTLYFFAGVATVLFVAVLAGVPLWLSVRRAVAEGRTRLASQPAAPVARQEGRDADAVLRRLEEVERRLAELEKRVPG